MAQEEEYDYLSSPGTPRSPAEGNNGEKKKRGLKKLISLTKKKIPNLDKSPSLSESGRFEEGSQSRRRGLSSLFKRSRTTTKDEESDVDGSATPTRELQTDQGFMKEAKKEETKPGKHEKTQKMVEKTMNFMGKEGNEASNEKSKPSKLNPPADEAVKEPKLPKRAKEDNQNHHHEHTQPTTDAKGKATEHQELESIGNAAHEKSHDLVSTLPPLQEKEVTEHDKKHHHVHTKDHKGDTEDHKGVDAIGDKVQEKSTDIGSPPPPPTLQEKEAVGCESIAQGFQKMCLPWTINKEDH